MDFATEGRLRRVCADDRRSQIEGGDPDDVCVAGSGSRSYAPEQSSPNESGQTDGVQVRGNQPLDDHDVKPAVIEARMFLVHANLTKSVFATERATGLVERKDAR